MWGTPKYAYLNMLNSVSQSCLILCNPMDCSTSGFPVLHHLPEFAETHVHWVTCPLRCYPAISFCVTPLLLLPSIFPSIRVFSNVSALSSGGQSIGALASASVIPMNIQGWFPLGLTGLISLLSKGLSRVFSRPWKAIIGSVPPKWGNKPRKLKM